MLVRNRLLHIVNRASVCARMCMYVCMCARMWERVYVCVCSFRAAAGMINAAQREGAIETDLISRPECDGR